MKKIIKVFVVSLMILHLLLFAFSNVYIIKSVSMAPTLQPNDVVFCFPISLKYKPQKGDILFFKFNKGDSSLLIKRVWDITPSDSLYMKGDNEKNSYDSRHFGYIHKSDIIGKPICILYSKRACLHFFKKIK